MRIALITDLHMGVRNDSPVFLNHFKDFFHEQFFPYLLKHNIDEVIILGDFWDRRKYTNIATLNFVRKNIVDGFRELKCHCYIIAGNHDVYHSNTLEVNSLEELIQDPKHFTIITEPREVYFDEMGACLFLPWICPENQERCLRAIQDTEAKICFAHLQLEGFEMHVGQYSDHGLDRSYLDKFGSVFTGHFHKKSSQAFIHYLGAPYEMTWADYNDPKGFHILDTKNPGELEYISNPKVIFHKVFYDDSDKDISDIMEMNFSEYDNSYVKIIPTKKNNQFWFDMFVDEMEKHAVDVKITEDLRASNTSSDEIIKDCENTVDILRKCVEDANLSVDKSRLDSLLIGLYTEALNLEI